MKYTSYRYLLYNCVSTNLYCVKFATSGEAKYVLREDFLDAFPLCGYRSFCTYSVTRLCERVSSGGTVRIRPHFSFPLCAFDV
jgi:hypothetical protein